MHNLNIQHDMINGLFFTKVKGGMARLPYKKVGNKSLELKETHVPESTKGMGVETHLVESALEYAKERGLVVESKNPLVKKVITSAEFQDLLVKR